MALNKEQALAVNHIYGPMLVLAGPGSGKTYTLVERVRHMIEDVGIPPGQILVITFSKKAALEMQVRFNKLIGDKQYPVSFGTFHAVFYHILKQYNSYSNDSILTPDMKIKYLKKACYSLNINQMNNDTWLRETLEKISLFKTLSGSLEEKMMVLNINEESIEEFKSVYDKYVGICKDEGKLDFDDMIFRCYDLLTCNTKVLEQWQNIFKYFLIDEFQDINDIQYEVLKLLAGEERNIFAVGDDDQSIYGFRGSKPEIMKKFSLEYENCKTVNLCKNYRCPEAVINKAGKLISNNVNRIDKYQIAAKKNKEEGNVYINQFENAVNEAEYVISELNKLRDENGEIKSSAILFRTTRCASILYEKLMSDGMPVEIRQEITGFYDSPWVQDVINYLSLASGTVSIDKLLQILNRPERNLSRDLLFEKYHEIFQYKNFDAETNFDLNYVLLKIDNIYKFYQNQDIKWKRLLNDLKQISRMTPFAAVNYILHGIGYEKYYLQNINKSGMTIECAKDNIDELIMRSKEFNDIKSWLEYIKIIKDSEEKKPENKSISGRISMMTAHASKGLEFDNVFIIGLQEGLFPHNKAVTKEAIEEERRLMYVAMTRSRRNLYICGIKQEHGKNISRFISEL